MNAQSPQLAEPDQFKVESAPPLSSCGLFEALLHHGNRLLESSLGRSRSPFSKLRKERRRYGGI
jgi:hypothetical protein